MLTRLQLIPREFLLLFLVPEIFMLLIFMVSTVSYEWLRLILSTEEKTHKHQFLFFNDTICYTNPRSLLDRLYETATSLWIK